MKYININIIKLYNLMISRILVFAGETYMLKVMGGSTFLSLIFLIFISFSCQQTLPDANST